MSITKAAKRVVVELVEVRIKTTTPQYKCPTCREEFRGFGPALSVTRFLCRCGQELIVTHMNVKG